MLRFVPKFTLEFESIIETIMLKIINFSWTCYFTRCFIAFEITISENGLWHCILNALEKSTNFEKMRHFSNFYCFLQPTCNNLAYGQKFYIK